MTGSREAVATASPIRPPRRTAAENGRGRRTANAFRANKHVASLAVVGVLVLFLVLLVAVPHLFASGDSTAQNSAALSSPGGAHWFGTDQLGQDVYTRTIYGARPIILASVLGVVIASLIGVAMGLIGGIATPLVSAIVMRILDVMLALPALLIALMVVAIEGTGTASVVAAISFAYAPAFARVIYGSVRRLRTADYVAASRTFGSTGLHRVVHHLLPNLATEIAVLVSSVLGWAILTAGTLSFLGFGVSLPAPDWGVDLSSGGRYLQAAWWISTFPGLAITAVILLSNYLGDYVSSHLDPHSSVKLTRTAAILH